MRKHKRRVCRAMRAWIASNVTQGFVPVEWYAKRNPRRAGIGKSLMGGDIGAFEAFVVSTLRAK